MNPIEKKPNTKIKIPHKHDRYEAFHGLTWWKPEILRKAKVMVVGAGALGNEVLKNLALLGLGNILIVDFDKIEYSNLCKSILFRDDDCGQFKSNIAALKVNEINPDVNVQAITEDIIYGVGLGVFRRMDVIIGCLDNRIARLYINKHSFKMGKSWVDGGIQDVNGQMDVYTPTKSCYECQLTPKAWELIKYRLGCNDVAQRNANKGRIATTPISSSIIGALQVQEALKIIFGNEDKSMAGKRFTYWGMTNDFDQYSFPELSPTCGSNCDGYQIEVVESELSAQSTLEEALNFLSNTFGTDKPKIMLDYNVVLEVYGDDSEKVVPIICPDFKFSDAKLFELGFDIGEKVMFTKSTDKLDSDFPDLQKSLFDLGIPRLQIIRVDTKGGFKFVELTGDKDFINFKTSKNE